MLQRIVRRLSLPRPNGEKNISILIFFKYTVIILCRRIRIHQSHLVGVKEKLQRPDIQGILIHNALIIAAIRSCKHITDFIISVKASRLLGIVHHMPVPILKQRKRICRVARIPIRNQLLHVLQHRQQIL